MSEGSKSEHTIGRRTLLAGAAATAVGAMRIDETLAQGAAGEAVPNTSGTAPPKLKVPLGACDCHHHIYDGRYPFSQPNARMIANARVSDYRQLQRRLGLTRSIVVTPAPFPATAADNFVTLDALTAFDHQRQLHPYRRVRGRQNDADDGVSERGERPVERRANIV